MLHELCGFRRLGVAAALAISVIGSIVLVYGLITPGSIRLLHTAELIAVISLFVLPALALATMRRASSVPQQTDQGSSSPRRSQHEPASTDAADRAERHRRRVQGATRT